MSNDPFARSKPEPAPQPPPSTSLVTPEERAERLSRIISSKTLQGFQVVDRNDRDASAVLSAPGKPVNHILHFLITCFTCGIWVIPWIIMAIAQKKEQRVRISIDQFGNMTEEIVKLAN